MSRDDQYRDRLYDSYVTGHQGEIAETRSYAGFDVDIVARVPSDRAVSIVDIGCGQGQLVRMLGEHGYTDVWGIDLSQEQVDLAKELGTPNISRDDLFGFAEEHQGGFDVVLAVDLIEHFDRADVQRVFEALSSLLRPGGTLIVRTPNGASPYAGRILFGDLTHGVAYTTKSLEQVAAATAFDRVEVFPVRPAGTGWKQRVRRALWRLIELGLVFPLVVETGHVRGHIVTQNLVARLRRA
ncbi:MAG: class I SAM-dependent methyltransferase [Solirubrobacteraceae bacterium]|nr:class I SAM-dependent methyltransferase [Solirubrobacteraceae bacterium]